MARTQINAAVTVWSAVLRVVEGVERLHPELHVHPLVKREGLTQTEVPVVKAGPPQEVPSRVAVAGHTRLGKCGRVKPLVKTPLESAVRIADDVGPVANAEDGVKETERILGAD